MLTSLTFAPCISRAAAADAASSDLSLFDSAVEAARLNPEMITSPPSSAAQKLFEGVMSKAQEIIDAGNQLGNGPAVTSGASSKLASSSAIPGEGTGVDLSGLLRAYDFAMRSYLLTKMVTETAGGLKSMWQAS